jgi:hypothetical protein
MADLHFSNHGSIITCTPLTDAGQQWIDDNVESEGYQWLGRSLGIEWRFAEAIARGAISDGLKVSAS